MSLLDRAFDSLFSYFGVSSEREKLALVVLLGTVLGFFAFLAVAFQEHAWITDAQGHPLVRDFLAFWAAGHQALNGSAPAAYDPRLEHVAEVAAMGHPFDGGFGWSYPPLFLFVAAALAAMPYTAAFLLWCGATAALFAVVVAYIARDRRALIVAPLTPWAVTSVLVGQNGMLTASLVGMALVWLEERPVLSGLMLGLLSYKPQFGVLIPLALIAGGYWRAFASAAVSVVLLNGIAVMVFGPATLSQFFGSLASTAQSHLYGGITWNRLQSAYGLSRALGIPGRAAMTIQIVLSVMLAGVVVYAWRLGTASLAMKSAVLTAALALATPYVFAYDLPVLAVSLAFLHRDRRLDGKEWALSALAGLCAFLFFVIPFPVALASTLLVGFIVARRAWPFLGSRMRA